ncbi:MAG: histidine--tRNA ligase [Epsilonproteobacteria bacterium]|nr:MAG: histidine--tRNA ligase [Campylobacterota bacterium]
MANIQSLRGMKDIIDNDSKLFTYFVENCSLIAKKYGYNYIETPILEETALFKRSVGESSDIVSKEMYQFIDKGEHDVCLRPEGTAGVVRWFVQNKKDRAGGINRVYYHGPMFRYERPQKGRLREFHQFGCESFGEPSVYEDATIVMMISEMLNFFGIGYKLQLNSLGCKECMPSYKENLVEHLNKLSLCEDCDRRVTTNPIRVLDCKNESCQKELINAPKITNSLCSSCDDDFDKLKSILNTNNISYEVDSNLVRGLDYYTKTAFEFVSDNIGAQSAIAGGGRYDRLVEFLGGKSVPAVGFAIGVERLLELIIIKETKEEILYIGSMCEDATNKVFSLVNKKRKDTKVITDYKVRSFSKHLNNAQKLGSTKVALIGEDELSNGTIWIKDFITKEENTIDIDSF